MEGETERGKKLWRTQGKTLGGEGQREMEKKLILKKSKMKVNQAEEK